VEVGLPAYAGAGDQAHGTSARERAYQHLRRVVGVGRIMRAYSVEWGRDHLSLWNPLEGHGAIRLVRLSGIAEILSFADRPLGLPIFRKGAAWSRLWLLARWAS
jgi:hypothetical protein